MEDNKRNDRIKEEDLEKVSGGIRIERKTNDANELRPAGEDLEDVDFKGRGFW